MIVERRLEDYVGVVDGEELESIRRLAKRVEGARVAHVTLLGRVEGLLRCSGIWSH